MMNSKSYVALVAALLLLGCGGSNSSHSGTTPVTGVDLSTARIEAVVRVDRSNLKHPSQFTDDQLLDPTNAAVKADLIDPTVFGYQDPTNFQVGEQYFFQLVAYPGGVRTVLPAVFATQDFTSTYGALGTNSGEFDAANLKTTTDQVVTATYGDRTFQALYDVRERQIRLIGTVQTSDSSSKPVQGATINFYDSFNAFLSSVTTARDGSFRASVSNSAKFFSIDPHSLQTYINGEQQPAFYGVFSYNGTIYTSGSADCRATLPMLTSSPTVLTIPIVLTSTTAVATSPAATGCAPAPGIK